MASVWVASGWRHTILCYLDYKRWSTCQKYDLDHVIYVKQNIFSSKFKNYEDMYERYDSRSFVASAATHLCTDDYATANESK